MNNEENNNLSNMNSQNNDNLVTITPINVQNNSSLDDTLINDNPVDNGNNTDNLIPITPVGVVEQNNSIKDQGSSVNISNNQELNILMPQMKTDDSNVELSNNSNDSNSGKLQLEGSSPFDIGVDINNDSKTVNINNGQSNINSISTNDTVNNDSKQDTNKSNDINTPAVSINSNSELTVGFYIKNMILFSIPIIGLILMIKKATNKDDKNESTFAKAYLILYVLVFVFSIILWISFSVMGSAFVTSNTNNINYTTTTLDNYN